MSAAQEASRFNGGFSRAWGRMERFARTQTLLPVVFALATLVFTLESIAVPVTTGRDFSTYILNYLQLGEWHALVPMWSLTRTPIASLAIALPLQVGGGWLAQVWMGFLFAVSVVAWTAVARLFGSRAAIATAIVLLLYPGYGILFHEDSSDAVFAAALALWAVVVAWAASRPSSRRFAAAGLGVGLLALVRPGNQVLLAFAIFCLFVAVPFRRRLLFAATFLVAAFIPILAWSVNNELRYKDFTVVRGGNLIFSRAFLHGYVGPDNGPASGKLARAVAADLVNRQPYRAYGITLDKFFADHSYRMLVDLYALSDRYWGWNSDYSVLKRAGYEAVEHHFLPFSRGVVGTLGHDLVTSVYAPIPQTPAANAATPQSTVVINGKVLPKPSEGEPIPSSHESAFVATPDRSIEEVWRSPTNHGVVFKNPKNFQRYAATGLEVNEYAFALPPYRGNASLARILNRISRGFPPAIVWLAIGLLVVAYRRPRGTALLLAFVAAAFAVLFVAALGVDVVGEYVVPLVPAFILLTTCGVFGPTARRPSLANG